MLLISFYRRRFWEIARASKFRIWTTITINEAIYVLARLCTFYAATLAPLALVAVLGGLQSFFVLFYGIGLSLWFPHILREDLSKSTLLSKVLGIVPIFCGAWLMNF